MCKIDASAQIARVTQKRGYENFKDCNESYVQLSKKNFLNLWYTPIEEMYKVWMNGVYAKNDTGRRKRTSLPAWKHTPRAIQQMRWTVVVSLPTNNHGMHSQSLEHVSYSYSYINAYKRRMTALV